MSTTTTTAEAAREELSGFDGRLIGPEDGGYEEARAVYNAMIDKRPALIARCADAAEVAKVVGFARAHDLPLAVRGGGHNGAGLGTCDDGVVIDLSPIKEIEVDPEATDRPGRRRLHLGRGRPRDQRAWPGNAQRDHLHDRRRRADPGWRSRPPDPQVRPLDRQPARGGGGAGERRAGAGQCRRAPGPVLGDPRRWRQLRRRHLVPVRAARGRYGDRRPRLLVARGQRGGALGLPRVHPGRSARAERVLRLHLGAPRAAVPRGAARAQGVRDRLVLRGRGGRRRRGDGPVAGGRPGAADERRAADAPPGPPERLRRALPEG